MEVASRRRSIGGLVRGLARHPKSVAGVTLFLIVASLWAWWVTQLWGLPDVGDPFDVIAFEAERVPDDQNAFHYYRNAASKTTGLTRKLQAQKKAAVRTFEGDWSKASPEWRDFVTESGEALALWRAGSELPDARYDHPEGLTMRTLLPVTQELRMLGRLGVLEGSRLETDGDMAGAWGWYRAALRSSRHSGKHGFMIERLVGAAMHEDASKAMTRWASDPRVAATLLRQALGEVIAIDAMTVPRAETLKLEYLLFVNSLHDPNLIEDLLVDKNTDDPDDWCQELPVSNAAKKPIQAMRVVLADDYERSLRLARLMTANWMAHDDQPMDRRSKLARTDPPIYEADPTAPPASRALPPEQLAKWLESSLLASRFFRGLRKYAPAIDRERARQARLVVHLASELYRREHGGTVPPSPQALVGLYLKVLPDNFGVPATLGP